MDSFFDCCEAILSEKDAKRLSELTQRAFGLMCDIFADFYIVTYDAMIPVMKYSDGINYADVYKNKEDAESGMSLNANAMTILMPNNRRRLEILYRNGFDAVVVHLDDAKRVVLLIDKMDCAARYAANGRTYRPELCAILNKMDYEYSYGDKKLAAGLVEQMYKEIGNGNLYVVKNRKTGEILCDETEDTHEQMVLAYTDVAAMMGMPGVDYAISKYGMENCQEVSLSLEDFAIPAKAIYLNDQYFISKEIIEHVIKQTEHAKRALRYIEAENIKNNLDIDGDELLTRLFAYPDMYREFVTGIGANLEFTGKITVRACDYSGSVLMETTANNNAAAVYSIIEKLTSHPDLFLGDFESGKLNY